MSSQFENRLDYSGEIDVVVGDALTEFGLGKAVSNTLIDVGFEDYNTKVVTESGAYVLKIFSKNRGEAEAQRCADIVEAACREGIAHPAIHRTVSGSVLYMHPSGLRLIAMDFIDGESFYDKGRPPQGEELRKIVREAVKINRLEIEPTYLFDAWAIPNIAWMLEQTREHLSEEGRRLAEEAFRRYSMIPLDQLPKAFVHGDLIKTNILLGNDEKIYVIDFSVSNVYPRLQEIAVMAANLLFDERTGSAAPLRERVNELVNLYESEGGELTDLEKRFALDYALTACAMEYMGSVYERMKTGATEEVRYWERVGFEGLREGLHSP